MLMTLNAKPCSRGEGESGDSAEVQESGHVKCRGKDDQGGAV